MSDESRTERRLAAILAADVVGYSRLMGADEEGTLAALMAHRRELIDPLIERHEGRIVKTTGDGMLIEFASIVDAVRCAIVVQQGMKDRNANIDDTKRIRFRVGINVGDVIVEDGDIFGDGVNVAARLEALAEPGEIYVSGTVREHVGEKLPVRFVSRGEQQVKNISQPIHVYSIDAGPGAGATRIGPSIAKPAAPQRTSIAVLPFDNMSGDPEQDYFADGMVEDITTGLSRFNQFFVIARNTMFTYKGKSIDARQVAAELGVRYVLEGSVRRSGNRVRVTGQLIDAQSGGHVWADRFDGELEDIFDLQDRITTAVVGVLEPTIRKAELERISRQRPEDMGAYDLYLQALALMVGGVRQENHAQAFRCLEQALDIDPTFVPALAMSSWCLEFGVTRSWQPLTDNDRALGIARAQTVLSSDSDDANAIAMAGFALQMMSLDFDAGDLAAHRALSLNPNSAIVQTFAGLSLIFGGKAETARICFEQAKVLSPADPGMSTILLGLSLSYFAIGDYGKALAVARQAVSLQPKRESNYWVLVSAYGLLGQQNDAREAFERMRSLNPRAGSMEFWERLPFRDSTVKSALIDGAKLAIGSG